MAEIPTATLLARSNVDVWKPATADADPENQGYQRQELRAHFTKVGAYLNRDEQAILPTSVLISVREQVSFTPDRQGSNTGTLVVPAGVIFWVVDGQHRIAGLRYAIEELGRQDLNTFSLPAVLMTNMPKFEEVQQFYMVNSTQKRIKTDLAQRLLAEMASQNDEVRRTVIGKGQAWLLRAVEIAEILNDRDGSPWEGRIQRPNMRRVGEVMIAESSFTQSLKPILVMPWLAKQSSEEIAKLIDRYWRALRDYMPDAFASPRDYALQKTLGTYPLHILAATIFEACRIAGDFSVEHMVKELEPLADQYLTEAFWEAGGQITGFSSRAGFQVLADMLLEELPEAAAVTFV
jgi:DGQHR domain-containing protein